MRVAGRPDTSERRRTESARHIYRRKQGKAGTTRLSGGVGRLTERSLEGLGRVGEQSCDGEAEERRARACRRSGAGLGLLILLLLDGVYRALQGSGLDLADTLLLTYASWIAGD